MIALLGMHRVAQRPKNHIGILSTGINKNMLHS